LDKSQETGTGPKAYLNFIVFNEDFEPIIGESGFIRIPDTAKEDGTDVLHALLTRTQPLLIKQPGYVYIYISNENETPVEVYFDDFKVEHVKSPVIQSHDYYPFGLTFNSYIRENNVPNQYQYNGKEVQNELGLGWLDYGARIYLPDIGLWTSPDPMAHKFANFSPYNYAISNPILFVDPNGMESYKYDWEAHNKGRQGVYRDEGGNEVSWDKVNSAIVNTGPTNVLITAKDRTKNGKVDWALEGTVLAAKATTNWRIVMAQDSKDAYEQLSDFTGSGGSIGNVIIDSHGSYPIAKFNIGNGNDISINSNINSHWVRKIGELFSPKTEVLLLACHAGGLHNSGARLLERLSEIWGVTVYGSQSWTSPNPFMFVGGQMDHIDPETASRKPWAVKNNGSWTKVSKGSGRATTVGSVYIKINGAFGAADKKKNVLPANTYGL
jgi:RHS repeat-associated protein